VTREHSYAPASDQLPVSQTEYRHDVSLLDVRA
jgi:hypothetical protein